MVLIDPPELKEYKGRVDPATESWPGSTVTRQELMAACGDPRDWFRYHHRRQAAEQAWMEFSDARRRKPRLQLGVRLESDPDPRRLRFQEDHPGHPPCPQLLRARARRL